MSVGNHSVVHAMCLWVTEEAAQHSSWLWVAPWKAWHACNSLAVIFQHVRGHLTEHTVDDDLLLVRAGRQHSSSSVKSVSFRIDSSRVYLSAAYGRSWRGQRAPTPAAAATAATTAAVRLPQQSTLHIGDVKVTCFCCCCRRHHRRHLCCLFR